MAKRISRFGDRMLAALLPHGTAGACIPENGQTCTYTKNGHCNGEWYLITVCTGRFNCTGSCVNATCVTHKAGTC